VELNKAFVKIFDQMSTLIGRKSVEVKQLNIAIIFSVIPIHSFRPGRADGEEMCSPLGAG
jgi:hypothetical protein